jgi:hypothetical protein
VTEAEWLDLELKNRGFSNSRIRTCKIMLRELLRKANTRLKMTTAKRTQKKKKTMMKII